MDINSYTPQEQERLTAISAAHAAVKKLRELASKITDDEGCKRWLGEDIDGIEATLGIVERMMDDEVKKRQIDLHV